MPDWAKAINKKVASQLGGETASAGTFVQPAGAVSKQVAYGAVGGMVGLLAGEQLAKRRRAENDGADDDGLAAGFPREKVVLGLTDTRLVVFSHSTMSGKPKELLAEYPLDDIAGIDIHSAKALHSKVRLFFADDSAMDFDAPKASGIKDFTTAVNDALS